MGKKKDDIQSSRISQSHENALNMKNYFSEINKILYGMPHYYIRSYILMVLYRMFSQRAYGAKMTSYRRRCDVITSHHVNTTSFLHHVPATFTIFLKALIGKQVNEIQNKISH